MKKIKMYFVIKQKIFLSDKISVMPVVQRKLLLVSYINSFLFDIF